MSLLDKATIITTPTAHSNGKLHSIKGGAVADFDVVRGSAATRVNAEGLIENINVIGSDLITNGDFSNGSTDWELTGNADISNGTGNFTGNEGDKIFQRPNLTQGKFYKITFDILNYTSGTSKVYLGNTGGASFTASGNGTHSVILEAEGTTDIIQWRSDGGDVFIGSIDNCSVKEVIDATNIPRIDYTTGEGVILTEPQSTNLTPYSEDFSQWDTHASTTITSNFGISPDGTQNANRVQMNTGGRLFESNSTPNVSFSVYAKSNSGSTHTINMRDGGGIITYDMVITDEWQRFDVYLDTTMTNVQFRAFEDNIDVLMWGAQVEEKSFATSYIPTSGAIATRLADRITGAGDLSTFNSTEGVLYANIASLSNTVIANYIAISDGTYDNRLSISYSSGTNIIRTTLRLGGFAEADMNFVVSDITDFHKVAFKYKENDFALWIDGVKVRTDTSGSTLPSGALTDLSFSEIGANGNKFIGKTKTIAVFSEALTDEELTCLTTI